MCIGFISLWLLREHPLSYFDTLIKHYEIRPFTLKERLLTQPRIIIFYISQIFYPIVDRLSIAHDPIVSTSFFNPWSTFASILTLLAMIILACLCINRQRILTFAILFFLLNHVIESSFLPLEMVFEHRNYLPSMFVFLPIASVLCYGLHYYQQKNLIQIQFFIKGFILLLIFLFGSGTYLRNTVWDNEITLWRDAMKKAPDFSRPYHNLGLAIKNKNIDQYEKLQLIALKKKSGKKK